MNRAILAFLIGGVFYCFGQVEPTPYDLIRPMWPLTWDSTVLEGYIPGNRMNSVPETKTPQDYVPNQFIPDTLNQAYLDALNLKISRIRVNQAGYRPQDQKLIYYVGSAGSFEVVDLENNVVGSGVFSATTHSTESSFKIVANISAQRPFPENVRYTAQTTGPKGSIMEGYLPEGLPLEQRLRIKVGSEYSATFIISENVYSMVRDATLKFFGVNRSGFGESWFHPASHTLDGSVGGAPGALAGGWYDCGDHLKESQTQAYAFMVLSIMAATNPNRDQDRYAYNQSEINQTDGIPDILREARHGADFLINAYNFAGGVIDNMPLSVGNFGQDHGWWGRPENQDYIPMSVTGRGGPHERDLRLGELGSNISSQYAAGLAVLSRLYRPYDVAFADLCLKISVELYEFAKGLALGTLTNVHNTKASGWASSAYNGNNEHHDDLGLAAITLLWATGDSKYLNDAVEDASLANGQTKQSFINNMGGAGAFRGGWFTHGDQPTLWKAGKNTSWANSYAFTLYAFYKLILATENSASQFGIDNPTRLSYIEDVLLTMVANLGSVSVSNGGTISLPQGVIAWAPSTVGFSQPWFNMVTDQTWIYNRYQSGNIFEVLAYADVAKDVEGTTLPNVGLRDWKSSEMMALGVNQMNYMLGVNPWDISMLLGVGDKNDAHPHHRGANPEGKNVPGSDYHYRPPVGALYGGVTPGLINDMIPSTMSWEDFHLSETCIDGTASFIAPTILLSTDEDPMRAPDLSVEIQYVGYDSTIVVVKQSILGSSNLSYGVDPNNMADVVTSSQNGMVHTLVLKPLQNGTTYYFTATSTNMRSGNFQVKYLVDSTQTPYSFTTLNSPPAPADIQNIKVCNVSADSAEIMWFTPNGEYESKIYWDTVMTSPANMRWSQSGDISGVPVRFHRMKIGGLKERTTYYYAVESNGVIRTVDENNQPLKFTTPVTQYYFSVRVYEYDWQGMTFLSLNIFNNEARAYDSLTVRLYMRATEDEMTNCNFMMRSDICQAYDEAGFNKPCENDAELRALLRHAEPVKLLDTYDAGTNTYVWYFPVPLGSSTIKSSSRLRFDVGFTKGLGNPGGDGQMVCSELNSSTTKKPSAASGDWSWSVHSKAQGDPVDYGGIPFLPKDFGDADMAPINPYVTVYRKDEFVWGYSPSYAEQITKRSNYKITTTLEAPFNVSNGTYVELDGASTRFFVRGTAKVTEAGVVNEIWVNGSKLEDISSAAVYNPVTDMFDLNIPVRLGIGANKVDVTIFAGPDLACQECQEFGGCAFTNNNFFVQYSVAGQTASSLVLTDANTGGALLSPAIPGALSFNIRVKDDDKRTTNVSTLEVLVINARKGDTTLVTLIWNETAQAFVTSTPVVGLREPASATGNNQISFYGGDTVYVRYVDPDFEDDVSQQSFFAESTYPTIQSATALDADCDLIPDTISILFSQPFRDGGDILDSVLITLEDSETGGFVNRMVPFELSLNNKIEIKVPISFAGSLTPSGDPKGTVRVFITETVSGSSESLNGEITDGILPEVIGISLLENPNGMYLNDTLKISYSEPVLLASASTWPLVVSNSGNPVNTDQLSLTGPAYSEDGGLSWIYAFTGNTNSMVIDSGFSASIAPNFAISDYSLNQLDPTTGCSPFNSIDEVPRPVPVKYSVIRDLNQNGSPDQISIRFERKLRDKDMLDSFELYWGNPSEKRILLPDAPRSWMLYTDTTSHEEILRDADGFAILDGDNAPQLVRVIDSFSVLDLNFADTFFSFGLTHGNKNNKGSIMPRLGPKGGFFDREYVVNDSIGPIAVSAVKATVNGIDSLAIVVSEPIDVVAGQYVLQRRRNGNVETLIPDSRILSGRDSIFVFLYVEDSPGAVRSGDYVRLISTPAGVYDRAEIKNAPPIDAPWIEVKGAKSKKFNFDLKMFTPVSGNFTKDEVIGYGDFQPSEKEFFRVTVLAPNLTHELIVRDSKNSSLHGGATLNLSQYQHMGPTFELAIQIPGVMDMSLGDPIWEFFIDLQLDIYDNLGQYVNDFQFSFELNQLDRSYLHPDNMLHLRIEWLSHEQQSPMAKSGRRVANGAYIARVNAQAMGFALISDEPTYDRNGDVSGKPEYQQGDTREGSITETISFGLLRTP
jgi:hypothetical protein